MAAGLRLYRSKVHPDHWIGEDRHGARSVFPAKLRGWASRTPYVGKARDPSGKPSVRVIGIRATEAEHDAWQRAAEARGISLAEWTRVALNDYATRNPPGGRPRGRDQGAPTGDGAGAAARADPRACRESPRAVASAVPV